jgi:hypothetical protein
MAIASIALMLPTRREVTSSPSANTSHKHTITPPTSDRVDRVSFSSVKENSNTSVTQSFTVSKTSSYLHHQFQYADTEAEEAIFEDAPSSGVTTPENGVTGRGFACPCDGFGGWKQTSIRGKIASKSFRDLKNLEMDWDWESKMGKKDAEKMGSVVRKEEQRYAPGMSPLEELPMELLSSIIDQLATDIPPNGFTARNIDLMSLLLTSRGLHGATLATLYSQITIPHSRIFRKFLTHITEHPVLGTIVRRLDFSHFNPTGAGQTARERAQTQNLTSATLLQCLSLIPNLREFLVQEHMDDDLDAKVLKYLLCDLPMLRALDFCASSSTSFRDAFNTVINASPSPLPQNLSITRLSFHECAILPSNIFETLLPRLLKLTHLDAAHTRITDEALSSIPSTAQITHLNLSKCSYLDGEKVVGFLSTHPAVKDTLVYLNLAMDVKSHEMLSSAHITSLLPTLPSSLRSLNLKGSKVDRSHIPLLLPLTKHIEELGLGRHLELSDLVRLFVPDENVSIEEQIAWIPHSLRYVDVSDLSIEQLDLGTMFNTRICPLLTGFVEPLEVLELSAEVMGKLSKSPAVGRVGWCVRETGRRGWLVRVRKDGGKGDSGLRGWKMWASYWGMRKVPVARAEVGGMYGLYMFKR